MLKIYCLQLSYDASDEEKEQAEKALICFDYALKSLRLSKDHVDIMGTPFKDHPDITTKEIIKYRAALRRYRDKMIENFNSFKLLAFKCINSMEQFRLDTQTAKLIKSFISSIDSIEDKVNEIAQLFDNLESKTFVADMSKNISDLYKFIDELEEIIDDRIKGHIKANIIGKTWVDGVMHNNKLEIDKKDPIIMELMKNEENKMTEK